MLDQFSIFGCSKPKTLKTYIFITLLCDTIIKVSILQSLNSLYEWSYKYYRRKSEMHLASPTNWDLIYLPHRFSPDIIKDVGGESWKSTQLGVVMGSKGWAAAAFSRPRSPLKPRLHRNISKLMYLFQNGIPQRVLCYFPIVDLRFLPEEWAFRIRGALSLASHMYALQ